MRILGGTTALLVAAMSCVACSAATLSSVVVAPVTTNAAVQPTATTPAPTLSPTGILPGSSPLSGRAGGAGRPVLVVKIDNTVRAQPQAGLRSADIVYIEEVEGGLTRLAAVFSTDLPRVVGPVRSARISDIDLLAQFGHPALAYSGVQHRMIPILAAAPIYEVSGDRGNSGYFLDPRRHPPVNFMGRPRDLLERAPKASKSRDIGFRFDIRRPAGGAKVHSVKAPYPDSSALFTWDASANAFDVTLNGSPARAAEGGIQRASTVVIQYVKQFDSGFGDRYGGRTPRLETVGRGRALILRSGRIWKVTWRRPTAAGATTFRLANGAILPFAPGVIWVALVNRMSRAVVG